MKTIRKPLLILMLIMLTGFAAILGGLWLWLHSSAGLKWLQSRINAAVPGALAIERYRLSLVGPRMELDGVTLYDVKGAPVAGFDHLSVAIGLWPLLRREIHLTDVRLEAPWADLVLDAASRLNLVDALAEPGSEDISAPPPEAGGDLPVNIVCRAFQLTDGRVSFRRTNGSMQAKVEGITLFAAGDLMARQADVELNVSQARYQAADLRSPTARIAVKADLDGDRLRLPSATIRAGNTMVDLKGSVEALTADPQMDGVLTIASDLSALKEMLNLAGEYGGGVGARLSFAGAPANPRARLDLTLDKGRIAGQPLDRLKLALDLADRQATIHDAALRLADGAMHLSGAIDLRTAFPSGFFDPRPDMDAIAYTLNLTSAIPDLNPWLEPWTELSGKLDGRMDITGRGITPSVMSVHLRLDQKGHRLLAPGMRQPVDADLNLSARMDQGRVAIDRLDAVTEGLRLTGTGSLGLADRSLTGKLELAAPELSPALAVAGVGSVRGACDATLQAGGSLDQPQLQVNLSASDLVVAPYTLGQVTIAATLNPDGLLNLSTLRLQNGSTSVRGRGRLGLRLREWGIDPDFNTAAAFDIKSFSVADFMASPPVDGIVDGRLTIDGPFKALQGTLALKARSLTRGATTIGDMDSRLRWDNGTVRVDRMDLTGGTATLAARGHLQLLVPGTMEPVQNPSFAFQASADDLNPGAFIDQAKGDFSLRAALTGSIDDPRGTIALDGKAIELAGQALRSFSFDGRLDQRKLWIDTLKAAIVPDESIVAEGWVGLDQTMAIRIKSDGITLANVQQLKDRVAGGGKLRLAATARGNIRNPDIDGNLTLSDVIVNGEQLDDMRLAFGLHDMRVKAEGDLNFQLNAACDLRQEDFNVDLIFDDTETASYFRAAGLPELHGKLSGRVNAAGNLRNVRDLHAAVNIEGLHLLTGNISLVKTDRIRMRFADGRLEVPEFELALLKTGQLHLKGEAKIGGEVDMTVNGRIPLAAAGAFSPELGDAAGSVSVDGRLSGTTGAPRVDARIDLEALAMVVPGLAQHLHDLNGRISLTRDTIRVQNVSGFLDTGRFSLDGTIRHERFAPTDVDLALRAKALPLEVPDTLSVLLNVDVGVTGRSGTAEAKGEITVLEGLYYKDVRINLLKLATERTRTVAPETQPLTIPYFDTVNLDIAIRHRQPFAVENNLAQLEISPDLQIGGTLARPIISGRAQVREGTVTFQKKTFEVTKGVIDFVNPYKTEAEIDIVSKAQIRAWTITLAIKGPPDNLDLRLSSVPSETDADILSLVLFGKTGRELNNGGSGAKLSTGQIMTELIADTFGEDIKKSTGIDILQVEENGSGDEAATAGVTVTVGKHLSDRMTVKYAVESKDGELIQRAISEYKLLENILVSGFQDSKGIYGSELVFRIEFR